MKGYMRYIKLGCLISIVIIVLTSCVSITAVEPTEAAHKRGKGKLITKEGFKFAYEFYPSDKKGPSVLFITGIGGKAWGHELVRPLNKSNFNFITFSFSNPPQGSLSQPQMIKQITKQRKNAPLMFPIDGKETASTIIVRNEISTIIEFLEASQAHDPEQGIYLIGGSYGSWLSLVTATTYPEKIKGVIFLSPALIPAFFISKSEEQSLSWKKYFSSLAQNFGSRQALAIGGKKDIIAPFMSKTESALDGVHMLRNGENTGRSKHINLRILMRYFEHP